MRVRLPHTGRPRTARPSALRQGGLSLVEILVALVAGLILTAGVGQVYLDSSRTYRIQEQLARQQENSRLALDRLAYYARMFKSYGCSARTLDSSTIQNTLNDSGTLYYNFARPVEGFEATGTAPGDTYSITKTYPAPSAAQDEWAPQLPEVTPAILGKVIAGSDVLVLRVRLDRPVFLEKPTGDLTTLDAAVLASDVQAGECTGDQTKIRDFCPGDLAMVTDCQQARVFQITAMDNDGTIRHDEGGGFDPGNACGDWSGCTAWTPFTLESGNNAAAEVTKVATLTFYISRRTPDDDDPQPGPSLYMRENDGDGRELVEGVENMQVLYGVDGNGDDSADQYLPADLVADWNAVQSIRVSLLMRTVDEVADAKDEGTYVVNGTTIDPVDDRRLRRVVNFTATARNRLP
jgi:type IV pilus assembly protein PilW